MDKSLKENQEFQLLKNEFFKRFGHNEVDLKGDIITVDDRGYGPMSTNSCGYMMKLRINRETGELEYYQSWWCSDWFGEDNEYMEKLWFEALCQALHIVKRTTYFLESDVVKETYQTL